MRLVLRLVVIAALIAVVVYFADYPGRVEIVWQGWAVDTTVGVLAAAIILGGLAVAAIVATISFIVGFPGAFLRRRRERRRRAGYLALTRGMVAVAAGDGEEARHHAKKAELLLAEPPLTLLLSAQSAQLNGDETAARKFFTAMIERPETEFLGLRGLFNQAQRAGDHRTALHLAERARALRPNSAWATLSLVDLQARTGQWEAAGGALAAAERWRLCAPATARHRRGVILYQQSLEAERSGDARRAVALAAKAQNLAADLAPLAGHHARLLRGLGRRRAAVKAVERAWRAAPHPDLAALYGALSPDAAPLARLQWLERLAALNPEAREGQLALAEAAIDARLWGEAQQRLDRAERAAPGDCTARLCRLRARLVEAERGAGGVAGSPLHEWLNRALGAPPDPCYVCAACGCETAAWQPLCPRCAGFDTLSWRRPARALAGAEPPAPAEQPAAMPATVPAGLPTGGG